MRRRTDGAERPRRALGPVVEFVAFVLTLVFAVAMLMLQANAPLTALRFMLVLHVFKWRVLAMLAPLALGALATLGCLVVTAATAKQRLTPKVWVWLMCGAFVAPVVAFGVYHVAIHLFLDGPRT